jgi:hypothetical protein
LFSSATALLSALGDASKGEEALMTQQVLVAPFSEETGGGMHQRVLKIAFSGSHYPYATEPASLTALLLKPMKAGGGWRGDEGSLSLQLRRG